MASFTSYMLRVNFSIIIIAMTKLSPPAGNVTEKLILDSSALVDDSFNWSKKDQGLLLSAYFYGYIFPNLLGGFLSERFGGRIVIFIAMFISAIVTGISPFAASDNFMFMFTARLVLGVLGVGVKPLEFRIVFDNRFSGFSVSSMSQHHLKVVAIRREGKVCFRSSWGCFRNRRHMALYRLHSWEVWLAFWLLRTSCLLVEHIVLMVLFC